jgi:hypothetical protein
LNDSLRILPRLKNKVISEKSNEYKRVYFSDTEKPESKLVDMTLEKAVNEVLKQIETKAYNTEMKSHHVRGELFYK